MSLLLAVLEEPERIHSLHRQRTERPEEPPPHLAFSTPGATPFVSWTWKALGESIKGLHDFIQERGSPYELGKPVDMSKYVGSAAVLDEVVTAASSLRCEEGEEEEYFSHRNGEVMEAGVEANGGHGENDQDGREGREVKEGDEECGGRKGGKAIQS